MIRRPSLETKINHERWLVSYSDFITLLFAFFVVMYSVSQVSEAKYKQLSETLENAFGGTASDAQVDQIENSTTEQNKKVDQKNSLADPDMLLGRLEEVLAHLVEESKIVLSGNEDWVEIDINANLIFESGKAELAADSIKTFTEIADVIAPYQNAVAVSGHTDNIPIQNSKFSNNWELSSARAVSVVNLLAYSGVKPERLSAVGYGEYQPVDDNNTEVGRANNRRVVLRVARGKAEQPKQKVDSVMQSAGDSLPKDSVADTEEAPSAPGDEKQPVIAPIELDNGGLLFTSDPESPRNSR